MEKSDQEGQMKMKDALFSPRPDLFSDFLLTSPLSTRRTKIATSRIL